MMTSDSLEFLLGADPRSLDTVDADMMLLEYLRRNEYRVGTKEGCASGDCGACTVVLARPRGEMLDYRAVNSCITNLAAVHGHQVITVEDLGDPTNLHRVQQALVDSHGSQCGFCTSGFVMSLFALTKQPGIGSHTDVVEPLSGNLCRCTGYRPILEAAKKLVSTGPDRGDVEAESATVHFLDSIGDRTLELMGSESSFYAPTTLDDACEVLRRHPDSRILAGGTDLALEVTQSLTHFDAVLYVGRVHELMEVTPGRDEVTFGAAVSYTDAEQPLLDLYPEMRGFLQRLGSRAIRNQGTIGGNLGTASPIGDMPPILLVLGADVSLASSEGTRRIPVSSFFLDYRQTALQQGELIAAIHVPRPEPDWHFRVYKVSKRRDDDISTVCVAINAQTTGYVVRDIRIAFGGMAATPKRAAHTEAALRNERLELGVFSSVRPFLERDFSPIDDVRASAEYRMLVAHGLLQRFCHDIVEPDLPIEVSQYAANG